MLETRIFNPDRVVVWLDNTYLVTGKGEGNFLTITSLTPTYTQDVDIDGEIFFIQSSDERHEIRLRLKDNSNAIDFINEFRLQMIMGKIEGINISIVDLNKDDYPKVYLGKVCKINSNEISKGTGLGEVEIIFLPKKYYPDFTLSEEGNSKSMNDAIFRMLNNLLKVKGEV